MEMEITIYYSDIMGPEICFEFFLQSYFTNPIS